MNVNRSGYYAYRSGKTYRKSVRQKQLDKRVKKMFFDVHHRRIGSRRMVTELLDEYGMSVGRCAVRSSYRRQKLAAIKPKSTKPWTTDSDHGQLASPNLLEKGKNKPQGPGEVIVGDITYLPLPNGRFSYLAMFQDMFTKQIVGQSVSRTLQADFVIAALKKAIHKGMLKKTAIVHTDRGSQYVATEYRKLFKKGGLRQSMSRRGNCYDNAQAESFFARFKIELLDGGMFDCHETAKSETFSYIEGYYNNRRPHSSIGNMAPNKFAQWFEKRRSEKDGISSFKGQNRVLEMPGLENNKTAQQAAI
jgi:transposase InsO family protein